MIMKCDHGENYERYERGKNEPSRSELSRWRCNSMACVSQPCCGIYWAYCHLLLPGAENCCLLGVLLLVTYAATPFPRWATTACYHYWALHVYYALPPSPVLFTSLVTW